MVHVVPPIDSIAQRINLHAVPPVHSSKVKNTRALKVMKRGAWSDESLQHALDAITDEGMRLRQASKVLGNPTSLLKDHLYSRTTTRQRVIKPTSMAHQEIKIVDYLFKMQDLGHPLTPNELCLKVATITQTR